MSFFFIVPSNPVSSPFSTCVSFVKLIFFLLFFLIFTVLRIIIKFPLEGPKANRSCPGYNSLIKVYCFWGRPNRVHIETCSKVAHPSYMAGKRGRAEMNVNNKDPHFQLDCLHILSYLAQSGLIAT